MKQIKTDKIKVVEPIRDKKDLKRIENWFIKNVGIKYAVIFVLGINSGLRISDLLGFNVGDVHHKDEITLREQKTGKYKKFPLKNDVKVMLNNFCKGRSDKEPLFIGRCGARLDRSQVYRFINQACEELKIAANVGTHTMRKTFGYHHYKQFHDIALLQEIFNHSSPDVTKRYIGITQDEVNDSYLALNLETSSEDLTAVKKVAMSGRTRVKRGSSFLRSYIKNGGLKHLEFARDVLEVMGYTA